MESEVLSGLSLDSQVALNVLPPKYGLVSPPGWDPPSFTAAQPAGRRHALGGRWGAIAHREAPPTSRAADGGASPRLQLEKLSPAEFDSFVCEPSRRPAKPGHVLLHLPAALLGAGRPVPQHGHAERVGLDAVR